MALLLASPGTGLFAQEGEGGPPEGVPPVDRGPPEGDPPFGGAPPVSRAGAALLPVEGDCLVEGASGMAHLISNPAHSFIIVVVQGLEEGVYTATLHRGDEEAVLGTLTVHGEEEEDGEDGTGGALKVDTIRGDTLPFGAENVADLIGDTLEVTDEEGCAVLSGEIAERQRDEEEEEEEEEEEGAEILALLAGIPHDASFLRGDSNADMTVDLSDAIASLNYLFAGGSAPYCADAADANDDGAVDISDPLVTLTSLFSSSGSLPAPSGRQGFDPTPDDLFCRG
jgi:hypothetical protein